jgi:5-methylcytosine-specific restriction endonuclease McrA
MAKAAEYVPYTGPIVTRAQAKAAGLPRYFTGNACIYGHVVERNTASGNCRLCSITKSNAAHKANREKSNANARAWLHRNKAKAAAQALARRQKDPEHYREIARRWARKNVEKRRAYHLANAEAIKARVRQWGIDNPERATALKRNRRARVAAAEGFHTGAEIRDLLKKQNGRCVYCSVSILKKFHADHIVSLADGGSNWIGNIQLTCPTCNMRKNRTDPIAFAHRMGRLL